jgi:hypothetical protein
VIDELVAKLSPFKFVDAFSILHKVLEHFREKYQGDFTDAISEEERALYHSVLGFVWTWVRLVVLRGAAFNPEAYQRDMSQFLDETEYRNHEGRQCTAEAIDYTFNLMKYAQKVARKDSLGGFPFPLNYIMHQRMLPVYLTEEVGAKSLLASNF